MLSVYLDESGTHLGSNVCVMGGLVATPARWERLSTSWQKILDEVGISDFTPLIARMEVESSKDGARWIERNSISASST